VLGGLFIQAGRPTEVRLPKSDDQDGAIEDSHDALGATESMLAGYQARGSDGRPCVRSVSCPRSDVIA
jgi:hypothetical protein